MIDVNIKFDTFVNNICCKISKSIGIMFKLRSIVPERVMITLYYCLVYPYLVNCNVVWGGTNVTLINQVYLLQKKVVRIILNKGYLSHTTALFSRLGIIMVCINTFLLCLCLSINWAAA